MMENRYGHYDAQTSETNAVECSAKQNSGRRFRKRFLSIVCGVILAGPVLAQERTVIFDTQAAGEYKGLDLWGFDTAWMDGNNTLRGVRYTGKERTDVIRFSFTGDTPLTDTDGDGINDDFTGSGIDEFNYRMYVVDTYTDAHTQLYLNNDTENWGSNPYLTSGGVDAYQWAELIAITTRKAQEAGRTVLSVAPFNEPDYGVWQGDVSRFGDVAWQLRNNPNFPEFNTGAAQTIRIMGGNTLNNDEAIPWYNALDGWGFVEEGNTHQLAGSFDSYVSFYQLVEANGDVSANDELHNVVEAMIGAQYGMDVGIWWYTAERARGEFVKASDGMRLAYAEDRPKWTAASVYRAPDGKIQAFVGESERQSQVTTYRFVSKDRPVFYDGQGPQRIFDVTTTGDAGYWTDNHRNAERVVNITWGDDVQPPVGGRYYLVNRASGQVMEVSGASTDDGANIALGEYSGHESQQWEIHPMPRIAGGDYSYFSIKNGFSDKALDVYGWSLEDGGDLRQWGTGTYPGPNQQYYLEYVEDGWFTIASRWSVLNVALDVNTNNLFQQEDNGEFSQQWRLVPVAGNPTDYIAPAKPKGVAAIANAASVKVKWKANNDADLAGYNLLRSTTAGGPYELIARNVQGTSYTDNSANQPVPYYYALEAVDKSTNRSVKSGQTSATPSGAPALVAHATFQLSATDSSGNGNDAVLEDGAIYSAGGLDGSSLSLNEGYARLPAEVVNHDEVTIASWIYWEGGPKWQRVFDFGNGTEESMFLTPANGDGLTMQFTLLHNGQSEDLFAPAPPVNEWVHLAVVLGDGSAELYMNGELVGSMSTSIKPSDFNPVINYIGKSQWPDPMFAGAIDEFRIYNYALSQAEVSELANAEPTPPLETPVTLINPSFEQPDLGKITWGFDDSDPAKDIPGWRESGTMFDSGIEAAGAGPGAYSGKYSATMRGTVSWLGEPAYSAYQTTEHLLREGELLRLNFAAARNWTQTPTGEMTAWLYYEDGSSRIPLETVTVDGLGGWQQGSVSIAADDYPAAIGHPIGIEFKNTGNGWVNIDNISLRKSEVAAPPMLLTVTPSVLAPANHKMVEVGVTVAFFDEAISPSDVNLTCQVLSNEPDDGQGDGSTTGDVNGADGYTTAVTIPMTQDATRYTAIMQLRAERSDVGSGREYAIECQSVDSSGYQATASAAVLVPLL